MTALGVARWIHLVAAATWLGGMVVLAPLVVTLRRRGVEREVLQAAARTFARVTWTALGVAVLTGLLQVGLLRLPWSYGPLHVKLAAVTTLVVLVVVHQVTASRLGPAARGLMEASLLVASLGVYAAAVGL